ncbi:TlpA disulfide reductase family protein [Tuwongella immobilis]|uniref:Thioredoxin domain-containing protein n=1 Tax=Tuwongella immobilis TaxID=692036 RepID=A0A6C2YM45_9BACT|nr:TlpA disulfide reductase family protein [Tuwongella immobilis]VIP02660.1 alkyl hydroperoxide partial : Redoxin domain protein OS=Pirellula staleyi (strain ATCC 27377 / DSM 6068 / ICPB 4128) GN=Psta_0838 PE=4 SV=1: Redoxin [Tuwongella immobilis]VTS02069.1 alkyl hydroperoxide partial : Redoxin domain protein OS=Pirellula staleyi (strain ATCC 27377 / DSM 6068 / ICPB 4128) GN=Psta_0838 PE=4 SV=1: Redoxin [Tuwongella immobilis]
MSEVFRTFLVRGIWALLSFVVIVSQARSDERELDTSPKPMNPRPDAANLRIGSPAPVLVAKHWFGKEAISGWEKDRVYVVDFWATWCGPCIASMPHLNDLGQKYRKKGLEVVAISTKDPDNTLEAVTAFVNEHQAKYQIRFCFSESTESWKSFMIAAKQQGIPCSFVIDRKGQIAFIGHPIELDVVLPLVLEDKWTLETAENYRFARSGLNELAGKVARNPRTALESLEEMAKRFPPIVSVESYRYYQIVCLLKTKQLDRAQAAIQASIPEAIEQKNLEWMLTMASMLMDRTTNPERQHADYAVEIAEQTLRINDREPSIQIEVAEILFEAGQQKRGLELGQKALDHATGISKVMIQLRQKKMQKKANPTPKPIP